MTETKSAAPAAAPLSVRLYLSFCRGYDVVFRNAGLFPSVTAAVSYAHSKGFNSAFKVEYAATPDKPRAHA